MTGYTCSAGDPLSRPKWSLYNAYIGEKAVSLKKITALYVFAACLFVFIGFGCNATDSYEGHYQAIDTKKEPHNIELMENGEGAWGCCDGEVLFTWYVKGDELRINTKEGGIMVGKLNKDSFSITLPGKKRLLFVREPAEE